MSERVPTILATSAGLPGMALAVAALLKHCSPLDVIEAGIRPVEADPTVRSVGYNGYPNLLGEVELDAAVMEGTTLRSGAVAALQGVRHPISVARQVMQRLPHVLLAGEGAARFAAELGSPDEETLTREGRQEWRRWLERQSTAYEKARWPNVSLARLAQLTTDPETTGTVAFLVRDEDGNIAAGVSTSGWAYKYPGRLGDSPIVGAGIYADDRYGAAACTGHGELTIRAGTARSIVLYMKMGMTVEEACREAADDLRRLARDFPSAVTVHAMDGEGRPYALAIGRSDDMSYYWLWQEGDGGILRVSAEPEDW